LADTNTAHGKGVNGLTVTSDGRYLVSLGLDEKIRLWDTETGHNTFVNYGSNWRNRFKLGLEATVSSMDVWPPLLYIPSDDRQVLVYGLLDGTLIRRLKGAYGRVICVENRDAYQELYSGSNGGEILVWEPPMHDDSLFLDIQDVIYTYKSLFIYYLLICYSTLLRLTWMHGVQVKMKNKFNSFFYI
jgi:DNA excision repair protein ERCC-8